MSTSPRKTKKPESLDEWRLQHVLVEEQVGLLLPLDPHDDQREDQAEEAVDEDGEDHQVVLQAVLVGLAQALSGQRYTFSWTTPKPMYVM